MKSKFLILPVLCFGLVFSSCDTDRRTAQDERTEGQETEYGIETERTAAGGGMDEDEKRDFVEEVSSSSMKEIEMAQLAQEKAQSQDVKSFAQRLADNHRQAHERLSTMAQQENIRVSQSLEDDDRDELDDLREKTGYEFDKEYLDKTVEIHENQIDKLENVRDDAADQELRSWADERLTSLREHRDEAERLKKSIEEQTGDDGLLSN